VSTPPTKNDPLVLIVDDDEHICAALADLLRSVDIESQCFSSTQALLAKPLPNRAGCMILDIRLPGINGLELQARLVENGSVLPIIFMTGHGDIPMSVRAMKAGAVDFLTKPFRDQDMLDAVSLAIKRNEVQSRAASDLARVSALAATLTPRERQVFDLVAKGLMNKQIAGKLGIAEITVKLHRGNVMRKMDARTLADLVRMAESLS
jgi:FixJ family two-component response regulator